MSPSTSARSPTPSARFDETGEADALVEDPEGVARLLLETRSGTDDTPRSYYIVDDFGRDKEVTASEWQRASLPPTGESLRPLSQSAQCHPRRRDQLVPVVFTLSLP